MTLSMQGVMNVPIMKQAIVRTAVNSLQKRNVDSVSVIELPVEDFVNENEFVLTTAIGCDDSDLLLKFVKDVISSDAAALAIATGRYVMDIPKKVINYANLVEFPIIEIPWEVRFSDITQSIMNELHLSQREMLNKTEKLQKKLLNLFLKGATLTDAAENIRKELESPVIIVDPHGNVKGKSNQSASLLRKSEKLPITSPPPTLQSENTTNISNASKVYLHENDILQVNVQTSQKIQGYLLMKLTPQTKLIFQEVDETHFFDIMSSATALWFQREHAILETELRLRDDFIWNLAKGETEPWDTVVSRAKSLNYNLTLPYICILGAADNIESLYNPSSSNHSSYEKWLYGIIRSIEEQMDQAAKAMRRTVLTTFHQNRFIIFLEVSMKEITTSVNHFLDRVDLRLEQLLPGVIMSWGIGENHAGVKLFQKSYNDARVALDSGYRQRGPGHRSTYANTGIYRVLMNLANNEEIQKFTLSTIGVLTDYDNQRGLDLVNTLISYIRNQGNVSQTARALHLHRQSLLYRLRKIESLTSRSLEDPDDLFLLNLSIKLWTTGIAKQKQ